tara:strand:- start:5918 stop:6193 length:276 start_codon:yes stop_codon:yes gene_type:complete
MGRSFNMIITIKNKDGTFNYDVSKIDSVDISNQATLIINKVGTIETVLESLNFASATHRGNLEALLKDAPEALVKEEEEEVEEETDNNSED